MYCSKLLVLFGLKLGFYGSNCQKFKLFFFFFKNNVYSLRFEKGLYILCGKQNLIIFSFNFFYKVKAISFLLGSLFRGFLQNWQLGIKFIGVGYRFIKVKKRSLVLKLGYSHLIKYYFNSDVKFLTSVKRPTKVIFFSNSKAALSQAICLLKLLRVPDNYKGKGILILDEIIQIKKREKFGVF